MKKSLCISTHLYPTTGFGGPSISFNTFLEFLEKNDFIFTAISTTDTNTYRVKKKNNLRIFFKSNFLFKYGFSMSLFLYILIHSHKYQNFIVNGVTNFPLFMGILFGLLLKKKVFIFTRGGLEILRTREWGFLKRNYYQLNLLLLRQLNKKNKLFLIFQSEDEKLKSGLRASNEFICANYSQDSFKYISKKFNKINILYIGRYSPEKGSDRLLRLLTFIQNLSAPQKENIFMYLAIASNQDISELNIFSQNKNIEIFYNLDKSELEKLFLKSNVLFFPSYYENFGNALVEGVMNGLLPVVYDDTHWSILLKRKAAISENELRKIILESNSSRGDYLSSIAINAKAEVLNNFIKGKDFSNLLELIR